jgi:hypothetical protein
MYLEHFTREKEAHIRAQCFRSGSLGFSNTAYVVPTLAGFLHVDDVRMGAGAEKVGYEEDGIPSWAEDLGYWDGTLFGRNVDATVLPQMDKSVW